MRTSKPISTISYNSPNFIKSKIEYWKSIGLIEFGMWIFHKAEQDEKKDHCHVFLKPAKLIQTMDLENDSIEIDPNNLDKPFKMVSFRVSKESDWLLYSIHDKAYLLEKGLSRSYHYSFDDVITTCSDTLIDIISHLADERKGRLEYRIIECVQMGMSWTQIVKSGIIPIRSMSNALIFYKSVTDQIHNLI